MATLLPYATHLLAFALGVATWLPLTLREGTTFLTPPRGTEEHPMSDPTPQHPRRAPTVGALVLILLLAALTIVGFGVQQSAYQHQARERDTCYQAWGEKLVTSTHTARGATLNLDAAREERDNAVDAIVLTFIGLRDHPPSASIRDLNRVLVAFAAAKAHLDKVSAQVTKTRESNPIPHLDCG